MTQRTFAKALVFGLVIGNTEGEVSKRAERVAQVFKVPLDLLLRGRLLVGTPERVAEQLLAFAELGVGDFLVATRAPFDYEMLQLLIEEVAPVVRRTMQPQLASALTRR